MYNSESELVVKNEINTEFLDENEMKSDESASASLNRERRSTTITNSTRGTNEEDILIKAEIKSENRDEFEFKLEFKEETVLDDLFSNECILQQIDEQTPSSPCIRLNTDLSTQQVSHIAFILPNDNLENTAETRQTNDDDNGNSKSGQSLCEESHMDGTSNNFAFIQNAVNREEEKLEISSASVTSKSKTNSLYKPVVKKQFKSTLNETKSPSNGKSLNTKRFLCEKCGSSFLSKSSLTRHTKMTHDHITRYECYFCCKRYFRLGTLFDHIRRHTKEQPFICCMCGSKFTYGPRLNHHIKTVHQYQHLTLLKLQCTFKCDICGTKFKQRASIDRHIVAVHQKNKQFKCTFKECNKRFARKSHLTGHMKIHTKEKECSFKCDICGSKFKHSQTLNRHIKTIHKGITPFNCTYDGCVYQCRQKSDLTAHMKQHSKELCQICKKRFTVRCTLMKCKTQKIKCQPAAQNTVNSSKENLEISSTLAYTSASVASKSNKINSNKIAIHQVTKLFKCNFKECDERFPRKSSLNDHMKIHNLSEKPFQM